MVLINLIFLSSFSFSKELVRFLTKYPNETLRYINQDGRIVYTQNKPGVLTLISGYNSYDIINESSRNDFVVSVSKSKNKVLIESIPNSHLEYSLFKNHTIYASNYGSNSVKKIGEGKNARLHVSDEWISYYHSYKKIIVIENLVTEKRISLPAAKKHNPFFIPEVYMVNSSNIIHTDVNEKGVSFINSFNQNSKINTIIYKSSQPGSKIEICGTEKYMAFGEFPYEGLTRQSKIMYLPIGAQTNLSGYETIYSSVDHDIGNMVCKDESIYFIKTTKENQKIKIKSTDVFKLILKDFKTEQITFNGNVNQLIELDQKIIIHFRGDFYIAHGENNLTQDRMKSNYPTTEEELPLDQ